MRFSYVYILTNKNHTVLYTGVTSNLIKRVYQHKAKSYKGFTARYNCDQLVFYQEFSHISQAIEYEKKIKGGSRKAKEKLIATINPEWQDLAADWLFFFQ